MRVSSGLAPTGATEANGGQGSMSEWPTGQPANALNCNYGRSSISISVRRGASTQVENMGGGTIQCCYIGKVLL